MDLEQFCILAASQKGLASSAIIQQVLSSKKVFLFGELLSVPSVAQLANSEHIKVYQTLELFAYGKYKNYLESPESYIELTEVHKKKLRQLTIVSLASESSILSYALLMAELDIEDLRMLEEIIIDSINMELIKAKIDQRNKHLVVYDFLGRDVRIGDVDTLLGKLADWRSQCDRTVEALQKSTSTYRSLASAQAEDQAMSQKKAENIKKTMQDSSINENDMASALRGGGKKMDSARRPKGRGTSGYGYDTKDYYYK